MWESCTVFMIVKIKWNSQLFDLERGRIDLNMTRETVVVQASLSQAVTLFNLNRRRKWNSKNIQTRK
jgi:hypothetical protein